MPISFRRVNHFATTFELGFSIRVLGVWKRVMKDESGKAGCSLARSRCARLTRTLNLIPVNMERNNTTT